MAADETGVDVVDELTAHFGSIGYTQERLHSGLLRSIVRWGRAHAFLSLLGVTGSDAQPCVYSCRFEQSKIDLVLSRGGEQQGAETLGFEFKVDANTTRKQLEGYCTKVDRLFLVTLGMSEAMAVYALPARTEHIGLARWADALRALASTSTAAQRQVLCAYLSLYQCELDDRAAVLRGEDREPRHAFRKIELLGRLARVLQPELARLGLDYEVKTFGVNGDVTFTICANADQWRSHLYLEVNASGKLSLKAPTPEGGEPERLKFVDLLESFRDTPHFVSEYQGKWKLRRGEPTDTQTMATWQPLPDMWAALVSDLQSVIGLMAPVLNRYASTAKTQLNLAKM